ncbi:MAG: hypothetical protein WCF42_20125, partial [Terriglobales bacterium]
GLPMPVTPRAPAPTPANTLGPLRSPVPPSGGPSVLGLNQPILNQPMFNQPSMDSLRETAFSGLDSFFEPEQEKTGGRRLLLLLVLLAALGGAGWWTYTNYLGATQSRKPEAVTSSADEARAEKPAVSKPAISTATKPAAKDAAPAPDAGSSQAVAPATGAPQNQPESGRADHPDATRKTADAGAHQPVAAVKPTPASPTPAAIVRPEKSPAKIATAPVAADAGDADFRKGEAYLYGRGAPENCDEAVKYLKAASAKSNAKSRSAFGTMYATGHCVPRDLPTSYLWFAQALRVDPNNQILEKDLNAVWNQMTPPERQLATRMKQ